MADLANSSVHHEQKRTPEEIAKLRAEQVILDSPSNKLVFFDPNRDEN